MGNAVASMPPVPSSVLLHGAQVSSQPALRRSGTVLQHLYHCVVSGSVRIDISLPDLDPHLGPANPNPLQYIFAELSKFKTIPLVMLYLEITVKIAK